MAQIAKSVIFDSAIGYDPISVCIGKFGRVYDPLNTGGDGVKRMAGMGQLVQDFRLLIGFPVQDFHRHVHCHTYAYPELTPTVIRSNPSNAQ